MMLRSWSNTLISVRQVAQRNAGRKTAGIDGEVALTSAERAQLAVRVHRTATSWTPLPVKRVYIPKAHGTKLRPLGIPVVMDRCHQARVRNALEPEWEARFEPKSFGFRPGRGCADAVPGRPPTSPPIRTLVLRWPERTPPGATDASTVSSSEAAEASGMVPGR
jgi:RNA-directed DNA polymerase